MSEFDLPLKKPKPDFEELKRVIKKEKKAEKVHFVELLMDKEIIDAILENYLDIKPVKNPEDDYEEYWKLYLDTILKSFDALAGIRTRV